jgi:hypothetical protein
LLAPHETDPKCLLWGYGVHVPILPDVHGVPLTRHASYP